MASLSAEVGPAGEIMNSGPVATECGTCLLMAPIGGGMGEAYRARDSKLIQCRAKANSPIPGLSAIGKLSSRLARI